MDICDNGKIEYGCDAVSALLDEFLDGETGADVSDAIEEHLAGCASCREALDEKKALRRLLASAAPVPPEDMSASVIIKVHSEVKAEKAAKRARLRRITAAAAAVVLAFGLVFAIMSGIRGMIVFDKSMGAAPEFGDADNMPVPDEAAGEDGATRFPLYGTEENKTEAGAGDGESGETNPSSLTETVGGGILGEIFDRLGGGFDGGYVILIENAEPQSIEVIAEEIGAEFDGVSFAVPYSEDVYNRILTEADRIGAVRSDFCGERGDKLCIIVTTSASRES